MLGDPPIEFKPPRFDAGAFFSAEEGAEGKGEKIIAFVAKSLLIFFGFSIII